MSKDRLCQTLVIPLIATKAKDSPPLTFMKGVTKVPRNFSDSCQRCL